MLKNFISMFFGFNRPVMRVETVTLLASLYFSLVFNGPFWKAVSEFYDLSSGYAWVVMSAYFVMLTTLQYLVFLFFVNRYTVKPILSLLTILSAGVFYFITHYGVYIDSDMVTNVLETDPREAGEILTPGLVVNVVVASIVPIALLCLVRVRRSTLLKAVVWRMVFMASALICVTSALMMTFHSFSPLMRNNPGMRYLVTPGNAIVSTIESVSDHFRKSDSLRLPIAEDATREESAHTRRKVFLLVLGETVRAQNWGLNGYGRQTTPQLVSRAPFNYSSVTSCGTSTAVSVPCMFSPIGRNNYDKGYIESHESVLDVLSRVGVDVQWIDNQSGCKGVCDRVPHAKVVASDYPEECSTGRCMDAVLVSELERALTDVKGDSLIVFHELGNHGPAYYARYPGNFRKWLPECRNEDIGQCNDEDIINAYDNAVLYNDSILSRAIDELAARKNLDVSLLYVSDHGESLGEAGVYLHGLPYIIAPDEQTHVPMIWWMPERTMQDIGITAQCMQQHSDDAVSHAYLFDTLLGFFDVRTSSYRPDQDLAAACRQMG